MCERSGMALLPIPCTGLLLTVLLLLFSQPVDHPTGIASKTSQLEPARKLHSLPLPLLHRQTDTLLVVSCVNGWLRQPGKASGLACLLAAYGAPNSYKKATMYVCTLYCPSVLMSVRLSVRVSVCLSLLASSLPVS